jgi:hypothetical protein
MHILTFILLFVVGSINAASHGDWSGIEAIGKFVGFIALFLICGYILTNPALLVIAIIIFVVILVAVCSNK